MIEILKYSNRKLYSKTASKYINLQEIVTLAAEGAQFKVIDNETKKDITDDTVFAAVITVAQNKIYKAARSKMVIAFMSAV